MSQTRLLLLLATTNKYWFCASKMEEILRAFSVAAQKAQYACRFTRRKKNVDADGVQFAWKVLALGRF